MNLGVLASHEGTTLQTLLDAFAGERIPGRVSAVVSNNGDSGALAKARQAGIRPVHLSSRPHPEPARIDAASRDVLIAAAVDVVFLAGYMKKLGPVVLGTFQGRILNTHPALLPRFGGERLDLLRRSPNCGRHSTRRLSTSRCLISRRCATSPSTLTATPSTKDDKGRRQAIIRSIDNGS